jgi:hypothetical protein
MLSPYKPKYPSGSILQPGNNIRIFCQSKYEIYTKIHRLILATKGHKGTQRKKEYLNLPNEKLLEVQKPFLEKVSKRKEGTVKNNPFFTVGC